MASVFFLYKYKEKKNRKGALVKVEDAPFFSLANVAFLSLPESWHGEIILKIASMPQSLITALVSVLLLALCLWDD